MDRWFNPHHPQTLQAAVILGYFSAVFGLLPPSFLPFGAFSLLLFISVGVGAFGTANNRRWGYWLLTASSTLVALQWIRELILVLGTDVPAMLLALNRTVFPVALAVAALHVQSRNHQKLYFQ